MVTEHGAALATGSTLAQEIGLTSNPISVDLQMESATIVAQLQAAPEAEFDELYIASQVAVHQQVLGLLDEELIPQADNEELSEYLDTIRASVAAHLEEAEDLLDGLN
jgi:putative membrane protein